MLSCGDHESCLKQIAEALSLETIKYYLTAPTGLGTTISIANTQILVGLIETLDTEIV